MMWTQTTEAKYGVAIYNFTSTNPHALNLQVGDTVLICEQNEAWFRGCLTKNKSGKGVFPKNYIHLKNCKVDIDGPQETITPVEDSIAVEIAYVLREWSVAWKRLYLEKKAPMFTAIRSVMLSLIEFRRQLLLGTLTQDQSNDLKAKITNKIDWGNKKLGLDLVPRIDSEQVDPDKISPVELFTIHLESTEQSRGISSRGSIRVRQPVLKPMIYHLHLNIRSFGVNVPDDAEVSLALYDNRTGGFFSERFVVRYDNHGMPVDLDKLHHCCCLFTDLGKDDLMRETWLVAHVYRIGPMIQTESRKVPKTPYRRPLGCAAMSIREVMIGNYSEGDGLETNMRIYSFNSESEFPTLFENIIKKQSSKLGAGPSQLHLGMVVHLQLMTGEMETLKKEHPLLFTQNVPIIHKMGFPDIIMPGDVRNDLYLTLVRGEFEKGSKTAGKNIEARVVLLNSKGIPFQHMIFTGAEERVTTFESVIFYHSNNPRWNETIKIELPVELFKEAHFRIEFRHCSTKDRTEKKLFGFCFAHLTAPDGTAIGDGQRELRFYKCEEASKFQSADYYIHLPSSTAEAKPEIGSTQGNAFFKHSDKESVYISTLLCSTKLTQNIDLIGLLNWRANMTKLRQNLQKLMTIDGEEIVKFLQDILDSLFSMFSQDNNNRASHLDLVFQSLVYIFSLIQSTKFEHFKSVIDAYIQNHFSFPLVHRDLLHCLKVHLERILQPEEPEDNLCMVMENMFQCIIHSRQLCLKLLGSNDEQDFKSLVKSVFQTIGNVLAIHFEVVTQTQCTLLKNTVGLIDNMLQILSPTETTELMVNIINRIPKEHAHELNRSKLEALQLLINTQLFANRSCRAQLMPLCMAQLKHHLVQRQELMLCGMILGDILKVLHTDREDNQVERVKEDMRPISTAMLDLVIQTILALDRNTSSASPTELIKLEFANVKTRVIAGQLVGCLVGILRLMEEEHYQAVLQGYRDAKPLKDFLCRVWTMFQELVRHDIFPPDWSVMRMVTNSALLHSAQHFAQTLVRRFLDGASFNKQLWSLYFSFAVSFLTQPNLQVENLSEAKREKVMNRYGDLRVRMGYEILSMWQSLGNKKLHFIPALVGPFLEVTMVPVAELRHLIMPVFFDMMQCEHQARGNFKQVETELIDKLDILISENRGDDEYKQVFNTVLLRQMQDCPSLRQNGVAYIQAITRLLERLLDYRRLQGGEDNIGKRMTCTVNLLNFYKDEVKREEMYLRYIYKLRDLHLSCRNYTEAGFTLLVHAQQLEWSDKADSENPSQREWQRKEELYQQIIDYFDKGKSWENGVPLCKELATLYETKLYNYIKLSKVLRRQAEFFENIIQVQGDPNKVRGDPEYFKVAFYGQGYPPFLRNKVFVYRGNEYERLGSFKSRLQGEYPKAKLVNINNPIRDSEKMEDVQYLQICCVKPLSDDKIFKAGHVPDQILQYYRANNVHQFQYDRPFHRGEKDSNNEYKTLCTERTTVTIKSSLPGILRWFEVEQTEIAVFGPVETAIDSLVNVNQELQQLICQYTNDPKRNLNPFTMRLTGVLDAAVSGGITKYQEAFFIEEFSQEQPDDAVHLGTLKGLLLQQMQILDGALSLHGQLAVSELMPLQERLVECFNKMKQGIRDSGSPDMARVLSKCSSRSSDERPISDISSRSSGTPTPPHSNRSSVYTDTSEHIDLGSSQEYCHLYQTPRQMHAASIYTQLPSAGLSPPDGRPTMRPATVMYIKPIEISQLQALGGATDLTRSDPSFTHPADSTTSLAQSSLSLDSGFPTNKSSSSSSPATSLTSIKEPDKPPNIPPRKISVPDGASAGHGKSNTLVRGLQNIQRRFRSKSEKSSPSRGDTQSSFFLNTPPGIPESPATKKPPAIAPKPTKPAKPVKYQRAESSPNIPSPVSPRSKFSTSASSLSPSEVAEDGIPEHFTSPRGGPLPRKARASQPPVSKKPLPSPVPRKLSTS